MNLGHKALIPVMLFAVAFAACGDDEETTPGTTGTTTTTTTTTTTGAGGAGANPARAQVAHLSPDAPAVDFCVRSGTQVAFQGPVLHEQLSDADGITYGEVSNWIEVPGETYTIRLVDPTQNSCATSFPGTADVENIQFGAGKGYLIAVMGDVNPQSGSKPLQLQTYVRPDEPAQGNARFLALNASPDTDGIEVGRVDNGAYSAIYTGIDFGKFGESGGNAWYDTAPAMSTTISVRTGGNERIAAPDIYLPGGGITSVYVTGHGSNNTLRAIICTDTGANQTAPAADCTTAQQQ